MLTSTEDAVTSWVSEDRNQVPLFVPLDDLMIFRSSEIHRDKGSFLGQCSSKRRYALNPELFSPE
jgi:hypothetical protein